MPTVAFITLGCKVNQAESESMSGMFLSRGYQIVDSTDLADVYVINTCSVTHLGERKSRQMVRRAIRMNPTGIIAVTGCFAQIDPDAAASIDGVDVIIGTSERGRIVDYVEQVASEKKTIRSVRDIMLVREFEDMSFPPTSGRTRAFLKIQDGCDNYCSYCIIPYARGHLRSRGLDSIRNESRQLAEMGYQEVVLTGINLGAYGHEQENLSLVDAVRVVLEEPRFTRIRLGSTDSLEVSRNLIELMKNDKRLCPHLHLPLQAGDDKILLAMRRPYSTDDYANMVNAFRKDVPYMAVTTDVIVGFPGESEEDFANTLRFVEKMDFAKIHIFPYSRRTGTPAASLPGQVGEEAKKTRVAALLAVDKRCGEKFRNGLIGETLPVLVESNAHGVAEGLTPNYQRIWFRSEAIANIIAPVRLARLHRDGLWGTLPNA